VIQEERTVFWEVIISVIAREKVHMNFLLVGLDKERSLQKKGGCVKINSDERAIFAHQLQSAFRLTAAVSNIYCAL
jgi:hypothetical protein